MGRRNRGFKQGRKHSESKNSSFNGYDKVEKQKEQKFRSVAPMTAGQEDYIDAINNNDITFAVGSAGSGKTYIATILAIKALYEGSVEKIILVRPIVEAGEKLGFLPGTFQEKVDPYMRPIYDAMGEVMSPLKIKDYIENGIIEVAPLAFLRGRTLSKAFIILDEAQNTTTTQMLLFLTRIGRHSKVVVTGDPSQVDLPNHVKSGLIDAVTRLQGIDGIEICQLGTSDVVRHKLVQDIIDVYDDNNQTKSGESNGQQIN